MDENERGLFCLNGLTGMLIGTILLLGILGILIFNAVLVQQKESQNFYKINQNLDGLKENSIDNYKQYKLIGKPQ